MKKKVLSVFLSLLMLASSVGNFVLASENFDIEEAIAELSASENVRFVNGSASTNGNGLTADTPYKAFSSAVNDLKTIGGTIVIVGVDNGDGVKETTQMSTLGNTGDILITSVYDGIDYRQLGAVLEINNQQFGYVTNPGKVTFDNINIASVQWNNWHLHGHETVFTDTCVVTTSNGADPKIQLLALISTGGNYAGNVLPDTHMDPIRVTVGNSDNTVLILGPCEDITIGDAYITIDGYLPTLSVSNNTWANYDHGQLRIDGDVFVTVNGVLDIINARSTETNDFSLEEFNGNLSVIVNDGGAYGGVLHDHIKKRANKWFVTTGAEGMLLSHGENGGDIVLTTQGDYNVATLENSTTGNSYDFEIKNGVSEFTLDESGFYTVTLCKKEIAPSNVRFVNGAASSDGNGFSALTPYKNFASAAADLKTTGGTIVVMGTGDSAEEKTAFASLNNTGDIVVTSVFDGVDYRENGAILEIINTDSLGIVANPGKVTFDAIEILSTSWANFLLAGHEVEFTESCNAKMSDGTKSNFQLLALSGIGDTIKNEWPDVYTAPINVTIGNDDNATLIIGGREPITVTDVNVTINGGLTAGLTLSSNSYNKWWGENWLSVDRGFGDLTVNGNVKVTVNGSLPEIKARVRYTAPESENKFEYSLNEVKGNIDVIVNHGGKFTNGIASHVIDRVKGNWIVVNGAEGLTVSQGEKAGSFVITSESECNTAILTNTTTEKSYSFPLEEGCASVILSESGEYTVSLENTTTEIFKVSFVDSKGHTLEDMSAEKDTEIKLPVLQNIADFTFKGWTNEQNGEDVKYNGGESYIVTESVTLYAVWSETVYPDNVRFVNGSAGKNGNGKKPSSPYLAMSSAVADLKNGGTVVVTGQTTNFSFATSEDILVTSVYNGVDYRETGAKISVTANTFRLSYTENPGCITFDSIDVYCPAWDSWHLFGYDTVINDTVNVFLPDGTPHSNVQIMLHASNDTEILPDEMPWETKITVGTEECGSIVFGPREELLTGGYDVKINGKIGSIAVSNNTYESYYDDAWLETAKHFGQLTVDGDVKITIDGMVTGDIKARKHYLTKETYDYGLKTIKGNLGVIINHEGSFNISKLHSVVKERTEGKWFTLTGTEGVYASFGKSADKVIVSVDNGYDYNYVTLKNTESNEEYGFIAGNGECEITIPESGNYIMSCSKRNVNGVVYVTSLYDSLCPDSYFTELSNESVILPEIDNQREHYFLGWSETENATEAEYLAGEELILNGITTLYAVWEAVPTYTVTFLDENGEVIHKSTNYAGAPIVFPSVNPYIYGKKLLGYAFEGETDILTSDALIPDSNKNAVPVFTDIPKGEVRIYVSSIGGNDGNDGTSPDKALATIAKAVELLKNDGGYIIVCGGANALTSAAWNNKGNITLTSVCPDSLIDYRAEVSDDGSSLENGAYITYGYVGFGDTDMTGKITIENLTMVNSADYMYICFNGHPYEVGRGLRVYQQKTSADALTPTKLCIRSLGESGSSKTNPEGIIFTIVSPEVGNLRVSAIGKASNTISGINVTVDSDYTGDLYIGNDSLGGTATVKGDVRLTFNGAISNKIISTTMTNPIEGDLYVVCNGANGALVDVSGVVMAEGYKKYILSTKNGLYAKLTEEKGKYLVSLDEKEGNYVTVSNENGEITDVLALSGGKAEYIPANEGKFVVAITDKALAKLSLDSACEEYSYNDIWSEVGITTELPTGLYRYGYIFGGWSDGENTYNDSIEMPENGISLAAIWNNAPKHTVVFDANGSSLPMPESVSEYVNEKIVLERPRNDSDVFIGWNENPDAYTGVLNYTVNGDKTLYAINAGDSPAYIIDSHYRGDPADYTGPRNSFRRYIIDVYLENTVASSGSFKLNTDNKFLYYLGHIPQEGITATVNAQVLSKSSGTPGLQYFITPYVEFIWESSEPIDTTNGRIKIARIMMYYSSWGMGYDQVEKRTTDEIVSAFDGYEATADGKTAYVSTNFYKGVKSDEVKINGKLTLEGREEGESLKYDSAKLFILDSEGDAVGYAVLEKEGDTATTYTYTAELNPGDYTVKAVKNGYKAAYMPLKVDENGGSFDMVIYAGDTTDTRGNGDGVIDIDDYTRILKTFDPTFPTEKYLYALDLNEDGIVNVSDLAIVKSRMSNIVNCDDSDISSSVTKDGYKLGDWNITAENGKISIVGGSESAVAGAEAFLENEYFDGVRYKIPFNTSHTEDYDIYDILLDGVSINNYKIVIDENDEIALEYAGYIRDYIAELSGFGLEIVDDESEESDYEIIVGATSRCDNPITDAEKYMTYESGGKLYVFYGDEQSAEMACLDLCEKILGKDSADFENGVVNVVENASFEGEWSVLTRYGVMSDSHIGARYGWADYEWLYKVFDNFEKVHEEKGLDFIVSLGDNIDDGYASSYASDYAVYLEEIKHLEICDPENPIEGMAEGKIPHYELCGNHDPIGDQTDASGNAKIRFFKNNLWYTENENGERVAHIAFFTDYGGYPLYEYSYSGSYASYYSYGKVNDKMVEFVEESIIEANRNGAKHIILYNHFGISQQVGSPCLPETGLGKIASVCEKYGIKLYFNGHEHDIPYTLRRYNDIYDYDASTTSKRHAVVEITTLRANVTIYNSEDGSVYRVDSVPLSGRGEAKQTFAQ